MPRLSENGHWAMGMGGQNGGYNQAMNYMQGMLDPSKEAMAGFEAPYLQNFHQPKQQGLGS